MGLRFKKVLNMNIAKIMIPKVCTVVLHERSTIRQGLEVLAHCHYTAIPVLDAEEHYVGSVTEGDFLRHIIKTGTTDRLSPIGTQCGPMGLNAAYGEETRRRFKSFCDGSFYIPMQKNNTVSIRMWSFMRIY